jgi:sugar phosphate isomerase/epimerase
MKLPIALQLYTIRDETEKDMLGTLEKVAGMGYTGVEFAGFGGISAKEMKAGLGKLGLKAIASHTGIKLLKEKLDEEIEYNLEVGCKYIICPSNNCEPMDDFLNISEFFDTVGEKCRSNGLIFGYHNHDFEFEKVDGEYYLDALFSRVSPKNLVAEIDTGWAFYAGIDPAVYIAKYKGRCPLLHLKDFLTRGERTFTEIGNGIIDTSSIIQAAKAAGTEWLIVEQDVSSLTSLESAKICFDNLSKLNK